MLSINRVLGLSIAVATSGLAVWAQAPAPILGFFGYQDGPFVQGHQAPATITISSGSSSAVANYYYTDGQGRFSAVFPKDSKDSFVIKRDLHVDVATDGRHTSAYLNQAVYPAPPNRHNELKIIMIKLDSGFKLRLEVITQPT